MITTNTRTVTSIYENGSLVASSATSDYKEWDLVWCQRFYFLNDDPKKYDSLAEAVEAVEEQFVGVEEELSRL